MKYASIIFCIIFSTINISSSESDKSEVEDADYWRKDALKYLDKITNEEFITQKAKNVVLFVGDGMGMSTITAGRIYKAQKLQKYNTEGYKLNFEKFPFTALSKTYSVDKQVTDSAAGATALFTGVKCKNKMLGLDSNAIYKQCDKIRNEKSKLESIIDWAQRSGKDTGFVTTTRVTHATPAALYAKTNARSWESDKDIPSNYTDCVKDIARQLIEDEPGRNFKVIMGGGRKNLCSHHNKCQHRCRRKDNKNLMLLWKQQNPSGNVVTNSKELMSLDMNNVTKIFGIFEYNHLAYQAEANVNVPSLANMTRQAIRLLKKNKNGFFLMVEGGKIDQAHHKNNAQLALDELADFDDSVKVALDELNREESLIVVTADHSHSVTFNGYSQRGSNILGLIDETKETYEILSYANGPSYRYHRISDGSGTDNTWRKLLHDNNRKNPHYGYFSARYLDRETHAGEDVPVYAIGAYSHLFRGTLEQNYIPHAIAYAACYKDHSSHCYYTDKNYMRYDIS